MEPVSIGTGSKNIIGYSLYFPIQKSRTLRGVLTQAGVDSYFSSVAQATVTFQLVKIILCSNSNSMNEFIKMFFFSFKMEISISFHKDWIILK